MAKYTIESMSLVPDYAAVAILNKCSEFHLNAHVDLSSSRHGSGWLTDPYSSCTQSAKDALDYCQRVYPGLNVVNVLKVDRAVSFSVRWCDDDEDDENDDTMNARLRPCRTVSSDENATVYKCLHGTYLPVNLYVPENCSFTQFPNQQDCRTDVEWTRLMKKKCSSAGAYLRDFRFMQWCNALTAGNRLSSFVGVEFVCCNLTSSRDAAAVARTTNPNEDDNIDYLNEDAPSSLVSQTIDKKASDSQTRSEANSDESDENDDDSNSGSSTTTTMTQRFFTILLALLIIIAVCVVVFKRRMMRKSGELIVPVNASECSPHDLVNNMQVNGYENPTYRYFELQS